VDPNDELERARRELTEAAAVLEAFLPASKRPKERGPDEPPYCSFCGAGKNNVEVLIAGPAVYICNECVEIAGNIIRDRTST
jgi:hypothetical protein